MNSPALNFIFSQRSIIYASKIFLASIICWYGLLAVGIENPVWAVITVMVVSDPNLSTTLGLAKTRAINTIVGCAFGLASIFTFGYSPLLTIVTACITVMFVTMISRYPVNWRLAPVTVVILMDAARLAGTHEAELHYVMMRVVEIAFGSIVSLALAGLYTKLSSREPKEEKPSTETE